MKGLPFAISGLRSRGLPFNMFRSRSRKKNEDGSIQASRSFFREKKLNRVREATAKRNAVRAYIGNLHAVSMRRVVLMDHISKFVGRNFTGRYVIKNSWGSNTKVNF